MICRKHPTRADAMKALALLEELISEFKFSEEEGVEKTKSVPFAVALSAMITPVVRGAFDVVPLHAINAPVASSGKSYLLDTVSTIATGQRMPVLSMGASKEETEKRLGSQLMTGQPLISIDNINGELGGDFLCQMIERPIIDIRILGRSESFRVESSGVSFFGNGNNMVLLADMTRRAVTSELDPQLERPELRKYTKRPVKMVQENRGAYVAACLTICRAYILAGRPNKPDPLSSFEDWSDTVRAALIWLGKADVIASIETAREEDPDLTVLRDVLITWASTLGTGHAKIVTTAQVVTTSAVTHSTGELVNPEFNTAIQAIGGGSSYPVDAQKLGSWLRSKKNRIVDGLRFKSTKTKPAKWWIEVSSGATPPPVTPAAATPETEPDIPF
jgi:hypothetical protein